MNGVGEKEVERGRIWFPILFSIFGLLKNVWAARNIVNSTLSNISWKNHRNLIKIFPSNRVPGLKKDNHRFLGYRC